MLLYKYFPAERIDVLKNCRIRFTPPGGFNDPFEFRPVLQSLASDDEVQAIMDQEFEVAVNNEIAKYTAILGSVPQEGLSRIKEQFKSQLLPMFRSIEPMLLIDIKKKFDELFNLHFGILCLSERWDSILMWGHYCQSHDGFVIGFDSSHSFFNQQRSETDEFGYLRKVNYQKKRPIVSLANSGSLEWFNTKADVWSYEYEWRMFLVLSSADEVKAIGQNTIHLFDFPAESVKEIIFGSKLSDLTELEIRHAVSSWSVMPTIYKSKIDDIDYKIVRNRI